MRQRITLHLWSAGISCKWKGSYPEILLRLIIRINFKMAEKIHAHAQR